MTLDRLSDALNPGAGWSESGLTTDVATRRASRSGSTFCLAAEARPLSRGNCSGDVSGRKDRRPGLPERGVHVMSDCDQRRTIRRAAFAEELGGVDSVLDPDLVHAVVHFAPDRFV